MNPDPISPDLKSVLKRLRLGRLIDTLPERLLLARQQKMPHTDFLLLVLSDEVSRRDGQATVTPAATSKSSTCGRVKVLHPADDGTVGS